MNRAVWAAMVWAVMAAIAIGLPNLAFAADYAPIDCAKAASAAERTICGNYALGQAEARMATLYGIAMSLVAMGQRGDIGDAQKQWLKTRDACGSSVGCLTRAYGSRIGQLSKVIGDIASRGPY
jgi:uncharacterized protein